MKTRPIIFNGEMIRAILDGRKSQTRRVVTPAPRTAITPGSIRAVTQDPQGDWWVCPSLGYAYELCCPYGVPGDRLWVRETWGVHKNHDAIKPTDLPDMAKDYFGVSYRATAIDDSSWVGRHRPSIHMPKWASRITLEVVSVRVERVGEISEADAVAEGCIAQPEYCNLCQHDICSKHQPPVGQFRNLWDSINGKKGQRAENKMVIDNSGKRRLGGKLVYGHSWDSNPWVWVVEFKVLTSTRASWTP